MCAKDVEERRPFNAAMAYLIERSDSSRHIRDFAERRLSTQEREEFQIEVSVTRHIIKGVHQQDRVETLILNLAQKITKFVCTHRRFMNQL